MRNNIKRGGKVVIFITFLFLCYFVLYFRPQITIENDTDKIIYLYVMERSLILEEPSIDEVNQIKTAKIIRPKSKLKIRPTIGSLLRKKIELDIGWQVGSRVESLSESGYQWFSIGSKNGVCSFSIKIDTLYTEKKKGNKILCFKRINPIEP
ncbi:hypothetical protein JK232_02760 [Nissabacter archeti]|uniref:SH3b domain-containing protein n=1 Tax=Nissabacter archeti TaxID=1917880 RepID=A0ABS5JCX7_9GAMM|nr:hypothetical protein [Nissabacter archeti]MBS0967806.1 hypothetical protein [Nissabacter archeti]